MILVDGGSVDGTIATARRVLPDIVTVLQTRKGKGNALPGLRRTGDIVVMIDADGSTDPGEIGRSWRPSRTAPTSRRAPASPRVAGRPTSRGPRDRQPGPQRVSSTSLPDPLHRPLLRLQRLLGRCSRRSTCDHARPGGRAGCWGDGFEIETLINFRVAAAGWIVEVPPVELCGSTASPTSTPSPTACGCCARCASEWRRARSRRISDAPTPSPARAAGRLGAGRPGQGRGGLNSEPQGRPPHRKGGVPWSPRAALVTRWRHLGGSAVPPGVKIEALSHASGRTLYPKPGSRSRWPASSSPTRTSRSATSSGCASPRGDTTSSPSLTASPRSRRGVRSAST